MRSALAIPLLLAAQTQAAPLPEVIDLAAPPALPRTEIRGAREADRLGVALARAGDWNADGRPDLLIGSPFATHAETGEPTGVVHVIFGTGSFEATLDLLSPGGFTEIRGVESGELCGRSVAGIGDWNADGFDDIAVGAPLARPDGLTDQGRVTILFGGPSPPAVIELASLEAAQGVTLSELSGGDELGFAVAGVGDFNADGIDDLAAGSPNADFGAVDAGRVYVVFGRSDPPASLVLGDLITGEAVFIEGANDSGDQPPIALFGDSAGYLLAGADIDGDGLGDVLLSAPGGDGLAENAGVTSLVFGRASPERVLDLGIPQSGVVDFQGAAQGDQAFVTFSGSFVPSFAAGLAMPGDVDGDGLPEIAIGSPFADPGGDRSGVVHAVRGRSPWPDSIWLASASESRVRVEGVGEQALLGQGLAAAGDVNADGLGDLVIGAPGAAPLGRPGAGEALVLFGTAALGGTLSADQPQGFGGRVLGAQSGDGLGAEVLGLGDWDGDGFEDLALSAPFRDLPSRFAAGTVFLLSGGAFEPPQPTGTWSWSIYR